MTVIRPNFQRIPTSKSVQTQHLSQGSLYMGGSLGGDGGSGDGIEARIAKLEAHAEHADKQLEHIKDDVRELINWGIGAVGLIFAALISSYLLLAEKSDHVNDKISQVQVTLQQVADSVVKRPH